LWCYRLLLWSGILSVRGVHHLPLVISGILVCVHHDIFAGFQWLCWRSSPFVCGVNCLLLDLLWFTAAFHCGIHRLPLGRSLVRSSISLRRSSPSTHRVAFPLLEWRFISVGVHCLPLVRSLHTAAFQYAAFIAFCWSSAAFRHAVFIAFPWSSAAFWYGVQSLPLLEWHFIFVGVHCLPLDLRYIAVFQYAAFIAFRLQSVISSCGVHRLPLLE